MTLAALGGSARDNAEMFEEPTYAAEKCDPEIRCHKCLVCAMELLYKLELDGSMYSSLYVAYKLALTLSCTQVSCERVFSTLKIIKNRLRSLVGQELLEGLLLLYLNREFDFDHDKVIDDVALTSQELSKYLKC
jgi:hypothetical protein